MPQVAEQVALAPSPAIVAQHTSPFEQLLELEHESETPWSHWPIAVHDSVAPPVPPPPVNPEILTQHSCVVESHVAVPHEMLVDVPPLLDPLELPLPDDDEPPLLLPDDELPLPDDDEPPLLPDDEPPLLPDDEPPDEPLELPDEPPDEPLPDEPPLPLPEPEPPVPV